MYSKADYLKFLSDAGLTKTDTVLIHSSMKKIGGDANILLDALMEFFKDGLLLMPTHTWASIKNDGDTFDVSNSKGNVGVLSELFRKRPNVFRSLHPTHSIAAYGKDAYLYIQNEESLETPCDPRGVYGRLYVRDAKILLIGVNHVKNTYIHSVEESFNVENRISSKFNYFTIIDSNKNQIVSKMYRHYCSLHPHVSECYQKLDDIFLKYNVETYHTFADTKMIKCSARGIYNLLESLFKKEKQLLVEYSEIPESFLVDLKI